MPFEDVLSHLFAAALWACINITSYINPHFQYLFDSLDAISAAFGVAPVTFASGLLDAVQSESPPSVRWFESLSDFIPLNSWGVYLLILKKPGYDDLLYIGSATAQVRGLRARISQHIRGQMVPVYVQQAKDFGYHITDIRVLAHCDIPSPRHMPMVCGLIIALEALLAAVFWTYIPSERTFNLAHMCPWNREHLPWLGLCSHSSLTERISGFHLTDEQLEEVVRVRKEKEAQYQYDYQRALRANPTPAFKERMRLHNENQAAGTKQRQTVAVETQLYRCDPCDVNCRDAASLRRHEATPRHLEKLERGDVSDWPCVLCNIPFLFKSALTSHETSKGHLTKLAKAAKLAKSASN